MQVFRVDTRNKKTYNTCISIGIFEDWKLLMDNSRTELTEYCVKNRKKAYFSMCRVSLVLLFFAFFSRILSYEAITFINEEGSAINDVFVTFLSLFGVDKQISYAASKMLLSSEAFYEVLSFVISFITLVIPAGLFSRVTCLRDRNCFKAGGKTVGWFIPMFFLCQLFTMLASVVSENIYSFLVPNEVVSMDALTGVVATGFNIYEFLVRIVCSCILVPLAEEYVFRGVIFTYLKDYSLSFGVIASAVLFGIAHSAPVQSVYAFSFGLFSAFLVVVTGNLKTSIIFHGLNNFITIGAGYVMGTASETFFTFVNAAYIMLTSVLGFVAFYKMFCKGGHMDVFYEKTRENDGGLCEKPGMAAVMAFPVAVYLVFYVLEIVLRVF